MAIIRFNERENLRAYINAYLCILTDNFYQGGLSGMRVSHGNHLQANN